MSSRIKDLIVIFGVEPLSQAAKLDRIKRTLRFPDRVFKNPDWLYTVLLFCCVVPVMQIPNVLAWVITDNPSMHHLAACSCGALTVITAGYLSLYSVFPKTWIGSVFQQIHSYPMTDFLAYEHFCHQTMAARGNTEATNRLAAQTWLDSESRALVSLAAIPNALAR